MRPISAILTLLVLLAVPSAHAAGVNMRWNACLGDGGSASRTFACDRNTGTNQLVGSFVLGADLQQVSGVQFVVDIATDSPTLPAWWHFKNAGSCRAASLSVSGTISPIAVNCLDWANGAASGGLASYAVGFSGPNTA